MKLNWVCATLFSITLFAIQATAQPPSISDYYTPSSTTYGPPVYTPPCTPTTVTITSFVSTILTSITTKITTTTTTTTESQYSQLPNTYDNTYIPPMKKKTGLIIGLVVGLCGLALLLLLAFLLWRRKKRSQVSGYGKGDTTTPGYSE